MKAGIVGGGIMGQLLAFSLINAGWNVTLFDQSITNNCSMAAAGLLTPVAELEKNELMIFHLGEEALRVHWPNILNTLKKKIYFQQSGSLILSHPRDDSELTRFIQIISSKLGNDDFYQKLNHDEICQLEPEASKFHNGYYFPNEAQIDNQMLLHALENYLIERDIVWFKNTIVSAVLQGRIILTDRTYKFDLVFDCRGLGAKAAFNDLRSVRGELVWLEAPDIFITRSIRFLHPRYNLYIVPRENQIYLIGASEIESHDTSNISVRTMLELLTSIYYVNSKFSEARIIKTVTQCRPTLSNHLPKIKYSDGLVAINGLYRHGFLIAPTLAHEVMQWVQTNKIVRHMQLWEKHS
jgi:glycine oxidase